MTAHIISTVATAVLMAIALCFAWSAGVQIGCELGWARPEAWEGDYFSRGHHHRYAVLALIFAIAAFIASVL